MITTIIVACVAAVAASSSVAAVAIIAGHRERKDLYNRIMCGSAKEYKVFSEGAPKPPKSRHEEMLKAWRNPKGSDD